ncbi:MucBP domain-containing protein [Schleiferilactobacillus harbinensis]|uniref:MucBP domain-containing protein n=1 Tax=Schleiferilactobacillus harbinensis TaxID=304207 RepID=UPI0039E899FE
MFGNKVHHVLHKVHKRWLVVGITALALGLTTTLTTAKAADTVSINYVSGYSVAVWQRANGVQATSKKLPTGTRWASYGAVQQGDNGFYLNVGGDQWIDSNYADLAGENSSQELRGVVTIQYVPGYGIAVWNSASGDRQIVRRAVLRHGTQWQVYRRAVVNGRTWYNLGGNQWIDGGFAKLTAQQYRGPKTYQSGGPTVIKPTEPTKPAPSTPIVQKVSYRVVTRDQYGTIVSTRIYEGNIGDTITIGATGIDGYTLNDGSTKTIKLSADSGQNDIDFSYTRNTPTNPNQGSYVPPAVTQQAVNYRILAVDDQGQPIIKGYIPTTGRSLPRTAITAPTISGYTVSGARTINVPVNGGDITFIYTKDAVKDVSYTIKAVDEHGVEIPGAASGSKSGQPGATISAPTITGYTVTGASTASIPTTGGPITFTYTKNTPTTPTTVTYQINAVDEQEKAISSYTAQQLSGEPGTSITAPNIPGYTIQGSKTAQIPVAGGTITFKYTKNAPAQVSYTIKIVDDQGNPISGYPDQTEQGAPGTTITVPPVTGYTLTTSTLVTVPAAGGSVTFTYTKDAPAVTTIKYTIAYVDENGQTITTTNPTSGEGKVGDPISAQPISGYTAPTEPQTLKSDTTTVTFVYKKDAVTPAPVKYTIEYLDQANSQAIATSEPTSGEGQVGDSVKAPNIDGYTVTVATAEQTLAADTGKITYIYTKNPAATVKYTIEYLDQANSQAITTSEPTSGEGKVGDPVNAPSIDGYTVTTATAKQTLAADTAKITFIYTKNAAASVTYTINFLDQANAEIQKPETGVTGKVGDPISAPPIPGYTAPTVAQTLQANTTELTFVYTKDAPATVKYTIQYLEGGNAITTAEPTSGEGKVGDPVTAPNIPGYTADPSSAKQTLQADTTAIKFTYTKNAPATVTYSVSYVDQLGAQIKDPQTGVVGNVNADVTAPDIDGYTADKATATQKLKADTTAIKFTYTQNAPAAITYTINFVDQAGDKVQEPQTGITGHVGDEIPAPDVPGYTAPTATQVLQADTKALTFTYTKKVVQTTVQFVDGDSGTAIADPAIVTTKSTYPAQTIINAKNGNSYVILSGQNLSIDPATQPTLTIKYKLITGIINAVDADTGKVIQQIAGPIIMTNQGGMYYISFITQARVIDNQGNEYNAVDFSESGATVTQGMTLNNASANSFPVAVPVKYKKVSGPTTKYSDAEQARVTQLQQGFAALPKPVLNNQIFATVPSYLPFNTGDTTAAFKQQTYAVFNFFRSIWGLPTTTIEPTISNIDQTGSSFMAGYMAGLQHYVDGSENTVKYDKPADMSDADWQKVNDSLKHSNIASLGTITPLHQTIIDFLADNHNLFGNNAGHRLNMLRPSLVQSGVGVGLTANAKATGATGTSNLTLDVWTADASEDTYTQDGGVMFYPGTSVFPIELLPAGTPISAVSYGNTDLRKVTKVTVKNLTANTSTDLTGAQLLTGGTGNADALGWANTTITAAGYTFANRQQYQIIFYGEGIPGGSISTTFKTFSFAG